MAITPNDVFNPSGELGSWISSMTNNVTGSMTITLVFAILVLVILIAIFKMPEIFYFVLLFPVAMFFTLFDTTFNFLVGFAILYFAVVLWSMFFAK